jgi:hypothetical protein
VLLLAVAGLAQPLLLTAHRRQTLDRGLARAIVVDTSASMHRVMSTGAVALDSARRTARSLASGAQASVVIESNDPGRALAPAVAWLLRQGRRAELVLLSDFQRGQVDSADVLSIPAGIGVTLHPLSVMDSGFAKVRSSAGTARATHALNRTDAEWTVIEPVAPVGTVLGLSAAADSGALAATRIAAATSAEAFPLDTSRSVAVVFPGYGGRAALKASARPTYAPWMADLLVRLRAEGFAVTPSGVARVAERERFVLFTDDMPGSLAAVRLMAIAARAMSMAPPARELDPESLPEATIASLQRPVPNVAPSGARPRDENAPSDRRWLWLAALTLLLLEVPLRRQRTVSPSTRVEETARAA